MIRSMLFIPGNSPSMLQNADIHGADAIILDLEDAVALDQKDAARQLVKNAIGILDKKIQKIVRINPVDSEYFEKDIECIVPLRPDMIMPAKVNSERDIEAIDKKISELELKTGIEKGSTKLLPLIETALGLENAFKIACFSKRIFGLFLGAEDMSSDLRAIRSKRGDEILYARGRIICAARAAGIEAFDTPFTDVNDIEGLVEDAGFARSIGFSGKASISPRHIEGINACFTPSKKEIAHARAVLRAVEDGIRLGKGAVSLNGKMIDKPIEKRARQVLEAVEALGIVEE